MWSSVGTPGVTAPARPRPKTASRRYRSSASRVNRHSAREVKLFQEDTQRKCYEADLAKVTHEHVKYPDGAGPGPTFYHLLAPHPDAAWKGSGNPDGARLKINIPETAVFSEFTCSTYFTSETGCVVRRDDLKSKDLTSFMIAGSGAFDFSEHIVAVQKNFSGRRCGCVLLSRAELDKAVDSASVNVAIQRLVHAAGARAAVSRVTVATGKTKKAPIVFVLTRVEDKGSVEEANLLSSRGEGGGSLNAKIHWLTSAEEYGTTGITQARGTTIAWDEPAGMCERIIDHVNRRGTRLSFVITELTADFVKEADGTWWMLQVKSFQSQPRVVPVVREIGGGGIGAGGVERRGVQSARHGVVRVVSGARGGSARGRGGDEAKNKKGGKGGNKGDDKKNKADEEIEKSGSDEAIQDALIRRLGKVPGCHGDYCNTLSVKELVNLREDHQMAVMAAKRIKTFEALPAAEKKLITAPPEMDAVDSSRPVATNKVAWRTIVLDREDKRAVKAQWLVRVRGQWMSYNASDAEKIEQGVQRGAVVVKLDRQFEIQFGVGMGDAGGAGNLSDDPPEHPAMQVVSTHPNVRYPVMRDPPLKDQTVLAEPPRYRRQKTMTHDTHVGSFYNMVACCHDCYRVYLYKDRQRMMSKTRPPVSSKIWKEETKHLVDPRMDSSRRGLTLGKDGELKPGTLPLNLTKAQIRTAGRIVKDTETSLMRQLRDADVNEVAKKFTMTLIDPSTGRRTQGLGGKWSPPEIQAGSRKHQIAIR